jgi:hypothetical protein
MSESPHRAPAAAGRHLNGFFRTNANGSVERIRTAPRPGREEMTQSLPIH